MYSWMVYIHVLATFVFLMTHGVSSFVALRLRSRPDPETARKWLGLYAIGNLYATLFYGSLITLLVTGIVAAFQGHWWGKGWIWLSLGLLVLIITAMFYLGTMRYGKIRTALGMVHSNRGEGSTLVAQASAEDIETLLAESPAISLTAIGFGGMAIILWLMMFKPF